MSVSERRVERERQLRDRAAELARENRHLRAERQRLERLLALALLVSGDECDPLDLLHVLADLLGVDLARSAWAEEQDAICERRGAA